MELEVVNSPQFPPLTIFADSNKLPLRNNLLQVIG